MFKLCSAENHSINRALEVSAFVIKKPRVHSRFFLMLWCPLFSGERLILCDEGLKEGNKLIHRGHACYIGCIFL